MSATSGTSNNNDILEQHLLKSYDLSIAENIYYYCRNYMGGRAASAIVLGCISITGIGGIILLTNHLWKMAMSDSFEILVSESLQEAKNYTSRPDGYEQRYKMNKLNKLIERLTRVSLRKGSSDEEEKEFVNITCAMFRQKIKNENITIQFDLEAMFKSKFAIDIYEYNGWMWSLQK